MSESFSDKYQTPPKLFKELDSIFNFFWDACCDKDNDLCRRVAVHYDKQRPYDYLKADVLHLENHVQFNDGVGSCKDRAIFMNPPYSNPLPFIKKAWEDSKHFRVVMLLKADMSTKWFNYALKENDNRGIYTQYQGEDNISDALYFLKNNMEIIGHPMNRLYKNEYQIGILHLRKRIKFYVSEEVFYKECEQFPLKGDIYADIDGNRYLAVEESKNYKRVEDGIVSKSSANFSSMIMIFDRSGK